MPDFTTYDAYIGTTGLIEFEDENTKRSTQTLPLRPPRQDTDQSRFEQRPEYGDIFAQGDFSGGAEQLRYHHPNRDETAFYWSEGIDIAKPGRLRLLHRSLISSATDADTGRALAICEGLPFYIRNDAGASRVVRQDGNFPPVEVLENPHAGEGNQNIEDLASSGDELYAAIGSNGIHKRTSADVWSHYVAAGATGIDRLAWVKHRLMAADGRNIYEVVQSGALPSIIETLPEGWRFEQIFEFGAYIYACAVHVNDGRSAIHHYGLDQSGSTIEVKGKTDMPRGQLAYAGEGYLGVAYIGGGVKNKLGGLEPFVYQAVADAQGFLQIIKLVEREASGSADLGVRAFEPFGETMYFGWCLGATATIDSRVGLAAHHIDRDAFVHHLQGGAANKKVLAIRSYKGRLLWVVEGDGLYYEDVGTFNAPASDQNFLITSVADYNNSGLKSWDLFEVSHSALAAEERVLVEYSTKHPDETPVAGYTPVITSDVDGEEGKSSHLTTVRSRQLALKLTIEPNTARTSYPDLYSYTVRSNPSPTTQEFVLTRAYRLNAEDRKDEQAEVTYRNPETAKDALQALANTWVTLDEPGQSWTAYVVGVTDITPLTAIHRETTGDDERISYVIQLQMVARKV